MLPVQGDDIVYVCRGRSRRNKMGSEEPGEQQKCPDWPTNCAKYLGSICHLDSPILGMDPFRIVAHFELIADRPSICRPAAAASNGPHHFAVPLRYARYGIHPSC